MKHQFDLKQTPSLFRSLLVGIQVCVQVSIQARGGRAWVGSSGANVSGTEQSSAREKMGQSDHPVDDTGGSPFFPFPIFPRNEIMERREVFWGARFSWVPLSYVLYGLWERLLFGECYLNVNMFVFSNVNHCAHLLSLSMSQDFIL